VKRYRDAVWQQEASNRVDHFHMIRDGVMPDLIHNYAHNSDWARAQPRILGRVRTALQITENLAEMPRHPQIQHAPAEKAYRVYNAHNASAKLARERLIEIPSRFDFGRGARAGSRRASRHGRRALERTRVRRTLALATISKKNFQSLMRSR